ncbi:MAG: type III-B CRISPR module-associated protein Cmr5 [Isosphaeraceae bacterium]|jgi:CRISPR-associated protein Cmr5
MMPGQTLDQRRAAHAWKVIQDVKVAEPSARKEFKIQTKKLPVRIVTSGLGQSLAFLEAKGYARHLREALDDWVKLPGGNRTARADDRLLMRIVQGSSDDLRFATAECLAYLVWLVRFADAEFRDIKEQED